MTRITEPLTTLPVVEPLQHLQLAPIVEPLPYTNTDYLDDVPRSPFTADDIAYLIRHTDGIVRFPQTTPIIPHVNTYQLLDEVNDKILFTQNMQGMHRRDHKRKLTKEEKKMDQTDRQFNLLLFSSLETDHHHQETTMESTSPQPKRGRKSTNQTRRRLSTSPITVPGTPDNPSTIAPKRPARFPTPNYEHRNTNYVPPPLTDLSRHPCLSG